jgi:hypothetical protein
LNTTNSDNTSMVIRTLVYSIRTNITFIYYMIVIIMAEKIYVNCEHCWKLIEQKMGRTLCIRCTNQKYKEAAAERRHNPEYKQMYMEKYKRNDR